MPTARVPKLCLHRGQRLYYVTDPRTKSEVYFGADRVAAERAYERWRIDYLRQQSETPGVAQRQTPQPGLTVAMLCASYLQFADQYYRKGGRRTSEYNTIDRAVDALVAAAGDDPASAFDQAGLKAARQVMVSWGWEREHVNKQVGRIRRVFRWAAEHQLVPVAVVATLDTVAPLRKGRCGLREAAPVESVAQETVWATLPFLKPTLRALVQLHYWSGMRAEEVVCLRPCDLDRRSEPWKYVPGVEGQKLDHLGRTRTVPLGPRARAVLLPLLECGRNLPETRWLFPSRGRGKYAGREGHVTVSGYRQAVEAACLKGGLPHWFPLQLRHSALTAVREAQGLDAAQAVGGHSNADTTQIYAQVSWQKAARVAEEMG